MACAVSSWSATRYWRGSAGRGFAAFFSVERLTGKETGDGFVHGPIWANGCQWTARMAASSMYRSCRGFEVLSNLGAVWHHGRRSSRDQAQLIQGDRVPPALYRLGMPHCMDGLFQSSQQHAKGHGNSEMTLNDTLAKRVKKSQYP